jgi:hypothetical protein
VQNAIRAVRTPPAASRDALTPAQRAAAVQDHQQAAMPEKYLGGRTTDPATWLRTPENLERLAAFTRTANARRCAMRRGRFWPRLPTRPERPTGAARSTSSGASSPAPAKAKASSRDAPRTVRRDGRRCRRASRRDAARGHVLEPAGGGEGVVTTPLSTEAS